MSRYVIIAGKPLYIETPLWSDSEGLKPAISVDDTKRTDTGLVDGNGNPIYRIQSPIGFGRR